jgi:toxin YoeB
MYRLYFTKRAQRDAKLITSSNLREKVEELLVMIAKEPYAYPPGFEILKGDLQGAVSRRINKQHRLVYEVLEEEYAIKVIMLWTHYE